MKKHLILALIASSTIAFSQEKLPYVDVDALFEQAAQAAAKEDYTAIIGYLDKVPKNDSVYCSVLSSKTYYLLQNNDYEDVISLSNQGIESKCYDEKDVFYINKIAALIRLEQYEQALSEVEAALKIFPYSASLWFNKANVLELLGRIEEAVKAYEHTITINPYGQEAHLKLGNLCYKQEKIAQALMCFNMYMLLSDDIDGTFEILNSLNAIASGDNTNKADPSLTISKDDASFEEIDLILSQKVALNKKYETGNKINIALVNQNHALLTWLKKYKGKGGFWDKKYVPFYQWVMNNDNFNPFTYYITQSIENESFKKVVKKNEEEANAFAVTAIEKWIAIVSKNDKDYLYKGSSVQGVGQREGEVMSGPFKFYDEEGKLSVDAQFDKKGERTGKWQWYYKNGNTKEILYYKNGKKEGENTLFFENGKKYIETTFKNDEFDGVYKMYNNDGGLIEKKYYKNGKIDGPYESYFAVGETIKEFDVTYKEDQVEGIVTEYHANGAIYLTTPFKETKRNGLEKKYNSHNKLIAEIGYSENKLEGIYKLYYPDGTLREEGASVAGFFNGPWKIYYPDGTLYEDFTYDNGSIQGIYKSYNPDGTLLYEYEYKKREIIEYTFYNREGKIINNERKKGGEFFYTSYSADEVKTAEGLYDISGGKTGQWKFYNATNGYLESEGTYKDNLVVGTYTNYYANGQIKSIRNYEDDVLQGYYVDYYPNGQMNNQTYYVDGKPQGAWMEYYKDGTPSFSYYYHKGEPYGEQIEYSVDGTIKGITTYDKGNIQYEKVYDNNEKLMQTVVYADLPVGKQTITYKYANGAPYITQEYLNGQKHGNYTKYYLSGKKMLTGTYINNMQHGDWTWYYENGGIEVVTPYHLNDKMGENSYYYEDGAVNYKRTYAYNELIGTHSSYFDDGTLKTETNYKNGKVHGKKTNYDVSGKVQIIRFYNEGKFIGYSYMGKDGQEVPMIPLVKETGVVKTYYDNGNIAREMEYVNGELEGDYKIFYEDGAIFNTLTYSMGLLNGTDIEYYKNGKVKREVGYLFGDYHGPTKVYYEDGTLKEEVPYKLDKKHGVASYYSKDKKVLKKETYYNGITTDVEKM